MKIGLQIPDFTWTGGPATLGPDLGRIARTADGAGFDFVAVMDHFFQIANVGRYDSILKTVIHRFDVGENGSGVKSTLDELRHYADLGLQGALGLVRGVSELTRLDIMGRDVIPEAAGF